MSVAKMSWYAFKEANTPGESKTWNTQGETLNLQIFGDASTIAVQVLGQVDMLSDSWTLLNTVNMTTLETGTTIKGKGIYMISVDGLSQIKVKLTSVSGGSVSVYGRIVGG